MIRLQKQIFVSICKQLLLFLALSFQITSADILQVRKDAPERYVVVKGDTLWDISGTFLEKPWHWPEIWSINPQIKDPHWIYPGDVLHLVYINGKPRIQLERSGVVRLSPKIRKIDSNEPTHTIRYDIIKPFLKDYRVVSSAVFKDAPYIMYFSEQHLLGGNEQIAYANTMDSQADLTVNRHYRTLKDPDTQKVLGIVLSTVSGAQALTTGAPARLRLFANRQEVEIGDRLFVDNEPELFSHFFPSTAPSGTDGKVISILNDGLSASQFDSIVINLGSSHQVEPGNVFHLLIRDERITDPVSGEKVWIPGEVAAVAMVFRVFEKVSYAVIIESTSPVAPPTRAITP